MSAEEVNRMRKQGIEEKNVLEEAERKKIAKITKVEFFDKNGKEKNVFQSGDDIIARISYHAKKAVEKPVFGVAIHTQDGIHISGPNTKTSKFEIKSIEDDGYVDFCINKTPFFSGKYFFTVAIFNWECITPFDFKDKDYSFKIVSKEENQNGLINLETAWKK